MKKKNHANEIQAYDGLNLLYDNRYTDNPESPRAVVIISHGMCVSIQDAAAAAAFDRGFKVYRYDLRGHGKSGNVASNAPDEITPRISTTGFCWTSPRENQALSAFCWATAWAALPWLTLQNIPIRQKAPFCADAATRDNLASAVSPSP